MSTTLTNSNVENVNVKLQFNDEFRRFFIPPHIPFSDLESKIKSLLGLSSESILIKYKDEEGEWITISSDDELETGLNISGSHRLFRLLCTFKDNNPIVPSGEVEEKDGDNVPEPKWKKYRDGPKKWKKNDERREKNFQGKRGKKFQEKRYEENEPEEEEKNTVSVENAEEKGGEIVTETTPSETPNDLENEGGEKKRRKGEKKVKGEKKKRGKKEVADEDGSSSESNSDIALLTLEEIKLELSKLREEEKILKEKVRAAKESWKAVKDIVNEKRKDEKVQPDEILVLREEVTNKKNDKVRVQDQLRNTRNRMDKLREAAKTKQV